eukprot:TRINITY_DN1236_c0_g1_i2.p2 TRINITY_DN1236_c0_g1~~TRINITY_DN1236_c0_g1_i2.p2  ORF type:complete len:107 (+),score=19.02 TRINITY_DN1236_c0_g1_i2:6-326(+)
MVRVLMLALAAITAAASFPAGSPWTIDVSNAALASDSAQTIAWLSSAGGFGNGRLQIDFSFHVLYATCDTPRVTFKPLDGYYTPDCDVVRRPYSGRPFLRRFNNPG